MCASGRADRHFKRLAARRHHPSIECFLDFGRRPAPLAGDWSRPPARGGDTRAGAGYELCRVEPELARVAPLINGGFRICGGESKTHAL